MGYARYSYSASPACNHYGWSVGKARWRGHMTHARRCILLLRSLHSSFPSFCNDSFLHVSSHRNTLPLAHDSFKGKAVLQDDVPYKRWSQLIGLDSIIDDSFSFEWKTMTLKFSLTNDQFLIEISMFYLTNESYSTFSEIKKQSYKLHLRMKNKTTSPLSEWLCLNRLSGGNLNHPSLSARLELRTRNQEHQCMH